MLYFFKRLFLLIALLLTLTPVKYLIAAPAVQDSIIGLYTAYYNRAPDQGGFDFWNQQASSMGNSAALLAISKGFSQHPQFLQDYPLFESNTEFVTKIYHNILNRAPDEGELAFWVKALDDEMLKSKFIVTYVNDVLAYSGNHPEGIKSKQMFSNKITVGQCFIDALGAASNGEPDSLAYNRSIEVLSGVTENDTSIGLAVSKIKSYLPANATLPSSCPEKIKQIKLLPPTENKIYFGAFPDFGGSEDEVTTQKIKDFEAIANKKIAWAYFSQNWFNGIEYPKAHIHAIDDANSIPFVRFMPRSNEIQGLAETQFSLQKIIEGDFDTQLRQWAKDAKEDNIPLLVDFAVEANGDWFGYSGIFNGAGKKDGYGDPNYPDGPERYRDAYRHIIDLFKQEQVHHITWFYHFNHTSFPNEEWNQPKYYYPGDNYIDWIGFSLYGTQTLDEQWEGLEFSTQLENYIDSYKGLNTTKPVALLEFGVTDYHQNGNKSAWLKDAFETILDNPYIKFSAISPWHENWENEDETMTTIRLDSSLEVQTTFKDLIKNERFTSSAQLSDLSITSSAEPKLLFKSGFEKGVYIDNKAYLDNEDYRYIKGTDSETGFSWPINILGTEQSALHYIEDDNHQAVKSEIQTVIGHNGDYTKALYSVENYNIDITQNPYEILDIQEGRKDLYIKYWMKMDSASLFKADMWRAIFEYKTKGYEENNGFRLIAYIYTDNDGIPYWHWQGDKNPENPIWEIDNKTVPVPIDEWFMTEFYWHWSEGNDGRALWKINGKVIGDHYGATTRNSKPIDFIILSQIYGDANPKYQWIDDIEIWSGMPE